jgi:hypothetical protein
MEIDMIILICKYDNGSASFHAEMIEGVQAAERRYQAVNGEMVLDGYPDVILHHDADYLLSIPGGIYRMPTPEEQDAKAEAARKAATVEESAPVEKPAKKVAG